MPRIFYGWWVVCACFPIGLYVSGITVYGFTAFFEPFVREFQWSYTEISFAQSLRGFEAGVFSPVIGILVDRFGSRKLILGGVILTGSAMLLLSVTRSLAMFYCSFFLLAFGATGCMGLVTMTAVANWFERRSGRAFGVMSSAFGASGLIVPLIVYLTDTFGWRTALVILGLGMWVMGIPLSFVIRKRPEAAQTPRDSQDRRREGGITVRAALRNRTFLFLAAAEMMRSIAVSAVVTHVMPYLSHAGVERSVAGFVAAGIPLCSIIGRFGLGLLADSLNKKHVLVLSHSFLALGLLSFCFIETAWMVLPFLFLFSSGMGGSIVLRVALLNEYFGSGSLGRLLGIIMGAGAFGGIIGPTLAGLVFDTRGSYQFAWFGFLGLILISIIFILSLDRKRGSGSDSVRAATPPSGRAG